MLEKLKIEGKEPSLQELIQWVKELAHAKQVLLRYGVYDVKGHEGHREAQVGKIRLEKMAEEMDKVLSFMTRDCLTYPYEGRIHGDQVDFYALYTLDELLTYVQKVAQRMKGCAEDEDGTRMD